MYDEKTGGIVLHEETARIIRNESRGGNFFRMDLEAPRTAAAAVPGQFVHVRLSSTADPLLRRPFSIYDVDCKTNRISILYAVVGRGTELLSTMKPGEAVSILAPLGNGFSLPPKTSHAVLIGGGAGIAPLLFLGKTLLHEHHAVTVMLGMQSDEIAAIVEDFEEAGLNVEIATNDGSLGACGHVTCLLDEHDYAEESAGCRVYACGPKPMLAAIQTWTLECGLLAELSLEERMGCGIGVCLSCVCKVKVRTESGWEYQRACVEGPVFSAEEVIFDD